MVKLSTPIAVLCFAVAGALAQNSSPSSSRSPAPSSSSGDAAVGGGAGGARPTTAPSPSSGGGSGGDSGSSSSGVCSVLFGDPKKKAYSCTYSSTTKPPYNRAFIFVPTEKKHTDRDAVNSLMSYFIDGYSTRKQDAHVSDVAEEMASSVLNYYPERTESKTQLASSFNSAIWARVDQTRSGALGSAVTSPQAISLCVAAVALVAGGAVVL